MTKPTTSIGGETAIETPGARTAGSEPAAARITGVVMPAGRRFRIGMVLFDNMTNLDFVGPHDILSRVAEAEVCTLSKSRDPVTTDARGRVLADMTLAEAPDLDMLFIGGGPGTTVLMEDAEVLAFLAGRAPQAQLVTSVCTGALVLGAAGLLRGYRAATHWATMHILPVLGATPVDARVVIDRNRITGGGVTAGIDFGLTLVGELWGHETAQMIQLGSEYDPHPPYNAGSPRTASPELVTQFQSIWAKPTENRLAAARRAAARFA